MAIGAYTRRGGGVADIKKVEKIAVELGYTFERTKTRIALYKDGEEIAVSRKNQVKWKTARQAYSYLYHKHLRQK